MIPGPIHVNQKEIFAVAKWIFTTILMIYIQGDAAMVDQEPLSWTQANYVVWAIMNTLTAPPGPYQKQTLNDLVYHCWIEGEIHIEIQAPQVVVTIPVFILAGNLD
jgi:hypothetical protein